MGIKWKKCKVICSLVFFVAGLSMLVTHLVPAVSLWAAFGEGFFEGQQDYQESTDFRALIGGRLSELLDVATGGQTYSGYFSDSTGAVYKFMDQSYEEWSETFQNGVSLAQEETVVEETADYGNAAAADFFSNLEGPEAFGGNWDDYQAYLEEQQRYYEEMAAEYGYGMGNLAAYDYDNAYDYYDSSGYGYRYSDGESLDDYMASMAQNKNIRYAVVYQNKLLYSNIEGFENGEEWKGEDFSEGLDAKTYNFTLWYNRENDGKVQIVKDGHEEDVYGSGVYGDESRWRVPGYANFTLGERTKEAVVFLAVAKEPQLYLVKSDNGSGYTQYGGRLYRMKQNMVYLRSAAVRMEMFLTAAVVLLALSLLLWKSRREGVKRIGDFLGKICLEGKIVLALALAVLFIGMGEGALGQFVWWLRTGLGYYNWSGDYIYEITRLTRTGGYLACWFWLLYAVALDVRMNGKRQKKPLFELLHMKDFKYPIQKRLVKRQRRVLIAELVLLLLYAAAACILWMMHGELVNQITGGYAYNYAYDYDVYEAVAQEAGFAFGMKEAYMLTVIVIFCALSAFTMSTFLSLKKSRRLAMDIGALTDQILAVREGSLSGELVLSEDTDLREAADNLSQIQKGMETALQEQMKSERMKVELVANVSHDIKTPLTSIISYVELLRQEEELPEHVKEFIRILGEKSERLKNIVQDVFEISKAASGQLPIQMETLDMGKLLRQTLADMNDQISQSTLAMRTAIPETPVLVFADGQRLYRVFQNLLQNALRYSLEGSRVYLTLTQKDAQAVVQVKNTSSVELADGKDFTERFVRGDESRTDGGSGLGLSIARSFTEACGGGLAVETDADLFTVTVSFPVSGREQAAKKQGTSAGEIAEMPEQTAAGGKKPKMSVEEPGAATEADLR